MQADTTLAPCPTEQWKCGNELLPYHPSASHVDPAYRDGWNACYAAFRAHAPALHELASKVVHAHFDQKALIAQCPTITTRSLLREFWRGYDAAKEEGLGSDACASLGLRAALTAIKLHGAPNA